MNRRQKIWVGVLAFLLLAFNGCSDSKSNRSFEQDEAYWSGNRGSTARYIVVRVDRGNSDRAEYIEVDDLPLDTQGEIKTQELGRLSSSFKSMTSDRVIRGRYPAPNGGEDIFFVYDPKDFDVTDEERGSEGFDEFMGSNFASADYRPHRRHRYWSGQQRYGWWRYPNYHHYRHAYPRGHHYNHHRYIPAYRHRSTLYYYRPYVTYPLAWGSYYFYFYYGWWW